MDLGQCHDLSDMVAAVQMALVELPVVIQRTGGQGQEALKGVLIASLLALRDEFFWMIRVLEVAAPFI